MFQRIDKNKNYLEDSQQVREKFLEKIDKEDEENRKTLGGRIKNFIKYNKLFFLNDEAEIAIVLSVGAVFGIIEYAVVYVFLTQMSIGFWRFFERINQIKTNSERLLWPLRK